MKNIKRILKTILIVAVILNFILNSFVISAHAADQTSRATKQVTAYMTAIRKYDIKKIKKMLIDKDMLYVTDKIAQRHIRRINRECLKYEISSVKIRGKSATVSIHVSQYNAKQDFELALRDVFMGYNQKWSGDKVIKKLNKGLRDYYHPEDADEYSQYNVKLKLTKKGNQWMINKMDKKTSQFKDAKLAHFFEDFSNDPDKYIYLVL